MDVETQMDNIKAEALTMDHYNVNFVSSGNLNDSNLDLKAIETKVPAFVFYMSSEIVLLKFPDLGGTVAFVSCSGQVVCGGAKSEQDATLTAQMVASEFSRVFDYPFAYVNDIKVEVGVVSDEIRAATKRWQKYYSELYPTMMMKDDEASPNKAGRRWCGSTVYSWICKYVKLFLHYFG